MRFKVNAQETVWNFRDLFRVDKISFTRDRHAGGEDTMDRFVFQRGGSVGMLIWDPNTDDVVLTEEFRAGIAANGENPWTYEIPAGAVDPGETVEEAGERETREEVPGVVVTRSRKLTTYYPSPGACSERVTLLLVEVDMSQCNLAEISGCTDELEDIRIHTFPLEDAMDFIRTGKTINSLSIIALQTLYLEQRRTKFVMPMAGA